MSTPIWPRSLKPIDVAVDLLPRPIGGGPSISGGMQWVQSDAGCWVIEYGRIYVVQAWRIRLYRKMAAILNGPATPILLPIFDCKRAPFPDGADGSDIPHSDGTFFSDGTGYAQDSISVVVDEDADTGDVRLTIELIAADDIEPGMFFSAGERLYLIKSVEEIDSTHIQVTIMPPLREAVAAGTELEFEDPVCRCVLENGGGMPLMLSGQVIGRPSLRFIEDFS